MIHKDWLENEYKLWERALSESTVHNFKEHPMVKRMLGELPLAMFGDLITEPDWHTQKLIATIDSIGYLTPTMTGTAMRMVYYAQKVLAITDENTHITEIGAGVGEFYAILRALGYKGTYRILDREKVKKFQKKYLDRVNKVTGLDLRQAVPVSSVSIDDGSFLVSFYALGEFDNMTRKCYEPIIKMHRHGLVIWNPHSGATPEIGFSCKVEDEFPLTSPGNKMLTW